MRNRIMKKVDIVINNALWMGVWLGITNTKK